MYPKYRLYFGKCLVYEQLSYCAVSLLFIIYLKDRCLLSKKPYQSWSDIQKEHKDFLTSLGPLTADEMVEYLQIEYGPSSPFEKSQILDFLCSEEETLVKDLSAN